MIRIYSVILLLLIFAKPGHASSSIFDEVGHAMGINPIVLWGIALQESTRPGHGPWPWTANINGKSRYYPSKADAIADIKASIDRGHTVDVGLMQVNWNWHSHEFLSLEHALDPKTNLIVATKILSRYAHHPTADAIGKYHCPNWSQDWCKRRAINYSNQVLMRLSK